MHTGGLYGGLLLLTENNGRMFLLYSGRSSNGVLLRFDSGNGFDGCLDVHLEPLIRHSTQLGEFLLFIAAVEQDIMHGMVIKTILLTILTNIPCQLSVQQIIGNAGRDGLLVDTVPGSLIQRFAIWHKPIS